MSTLTSVHEPLALNAGWVEFATESCGPCEFLVLQRRRRFSVFVLRRANSEWVLKLARTAAGDDDIRAEFGSLDRVSKMRALPADALPRPVKLGTINGRAACVLTAVQGEKLLLWTAATDTLLASIAQRFRTVASATRRMVPAISSSTRSVLERAAGVPHSAVMPLPVQAMFDTVCETWARQPERSAVLTHGDCTGSNILFGPSGPAFIDWTGCVEEGFEHFDALWLSWYLLTKQDGFPPERIVEQVLHPDTRNAVGRFLIHTWVDEDAINRKRAVLTMVAVLAARYVQAGHHDRTRPLIEAASKLHI